MSTSRIGSPLPSCTAIPFATRLTKPRDLLGWHVVAELAACLLLSDVLDECGRELLLGLRAVQAAEVGIRPLLPAHLEVDADPVGVLLDDLAQRRLPALLHPELDQPLVVASCKLEEEVVLGGEVVEDRAAREADPCQPRTVARS